jgi:hypothetical protein
MRRRILFPNWRQVWASLFSQQSAIAGRSPAVIAEPNHGISDEPKQQSRQWIWWVVVLFALYPLSIGPMTGFYAGTVDPWPRMAYEAFYAPLFWVCERVPGLERAIEAYIELWWRLCWKGRPPR